MTTLRETVGKPDHVLRPPVGLAEPDVMPVEAKTPKSVCEAVTKRERNNIRLWLSAVVRA